jgi:16S rRNA (uracil1498-N3)-methyltransferase
MQNLFYQPGISTGVTHLNPDESRHCIKVLRKKNGEIIFITDGRGNIFEAEVTKADPDNCQFTVHRSKHYLAKPYAFHLGIAPTKNADRMEWLVEKSIEIGIDRISFIQTAHSERTTLNAQRLEKIAVSAMKQSLYPYLPEIESVIPINQFLNRITSNQKFIAQAKPGNPHLMDSASPGGSCTVLIGPEGDFAPDELDQAIAKGFIPVSLGTSRLRTETAGLTACHILSLINRHFIKNPTSLTKCA